MPELGEAKDLDVKSGEATEGSSPSTDEMGASSSTNTDTANVGDIANKSLSDFVKEQVKAPDKGDADPKAETGKKPGEEETTDAKKKEEGETEKKEDAPSEEKTEDEKKPVPYERFEEVNSRAKELDQRIQEATPALQAYERINAYCSINGITTEQFEKALKVQSLLNNDPEAALKELLPIVESLQGFAGNKLPDDLQKKVDEGRMELDDAKEMAKYRARMQFGEKKTQYDQRRAEEQRAQESQRQMMQSLQKWETSKRGTDPDYKPKENDKADDGKWELTKDKYLALLNQIDARGQYVNPVRGDQDVIALMEKAYAYASNLTKKMSFRPATRKSLSSNGSSSTSTKMTIESAPTLADAVRIAVGGRVNGE